MVGSERLSTAISKADRRSKVGATLAVEISLRSGGVYAGSIL